MVLGSSFFNLAALLGMGAAVAGPMALHRRVIALSGCMSVFSAAGGLVALSAPSQPAPVLAAVGVLLVTYLAVLGTAGRGLEWLPLGSPARLVAAVTEEEAELADVLRPDPGRALDAIVAVAALVVVVVASVVMEKSAVSLGSRLGVPQIVIGALVLGWVTGIPNAVASTFLARRGRGAAALSTALNTNNFNVTVGLLLPAVAVGLGQRSGQTLLVAGWCLGLTLATLGWAYLSSGMGRRAGMAVIAAYVAFAVSVVAAGSI